MILLSSIVAILIATTTATRITCANARTGAHPICSTAACGELKGKVAKIEKHTTQHNSCYLYEKNASE